MRSMQYIFKYWYLVIQLFWDSLVNILSTTILNIRCSLWPFYRIWDSSEARATLSRFCKKVCKTPQIKTHISIEQQKPSNGYKRSRKIFCSICKYRKISEFPNYIQGVPKKNWIYVLEITITISPKPLNFGCVQGDKWHI